MRRPFIVSLILIVALGALYFWSMRGIAVDARVARKGEHVEFWFAGQLLGEADVPSTCTVNLLRVEFDYQDLYGRYFEGTSSTDRPNVPLPAGDFDFPFVLRNPIKVVFRLLGPEGHKVNFLILPYRHLDAHWEDADNVLQNKKQQRPKIPFLTGVQWILWVALKPYPIAVALFFAIWLSRGVRREEPVELPLPDGSGMRRTHWWMLLAGIAPAISFFWSRYLMHNYLLDAPHVPDAVHYVLLAKVLASGHFVMPFGDVPAIVPRGDIAAYFDLWFNALNDTLAVRYPLGHPLVLAIGQLFHAMELVPPLVGCATLVLVFFLAWKITRSVAAGVGAQLICLASPFFQTQTVDYMSHNTAAMYLLAALLPLGSRKRPWFAFTGFFLGMLMNTRPLTFLGAFAAVMLYEAIRVVRVRDWMDCFRRILWGAIGGLAPALLFLYYNHCVTGSIFETPYKYHGLTNRVMWGQDFFMGYGLLHGFSNLVAFSLFFLRNYYVSFVPLLLSIFMLPFCAGRRRMLFALQSTAIAIFVMWMFYDGNFFMYGPRFIYEAAPVLTVLYAVIICLCYRQIRRRLGRVIFFIALAVWVWSIGVFEVQWLGLRRPEYLGIVYVPSSIKDLRGFNAIDDRFVRFYEKHKGEDSLILMTNESSWWSTGGGVWMNEFPLTRSHPLILNKPLDEKIPIPKGAVVIEWSKLEPGKK
jgi:hypothetical protein